MLEIISFQLKFANQTFHMWLTSDLRVSDVWLTTYDLLVSYEPPEWNRYSLNSWHYYSDIP